MPTYEYKCKKCDRHFDVFQSMTEAPVKECPHCHGKAVERLIGAGAAILMHGARPSPPPMGGCGPDAPCFGGGSCGLARNG